MDCLFILLLILTEEQFEQVMTFDEDESMKKKWRAFCRKIDTKTDDYSIVLRTIKIFLSKPFMAAVEDNEYSGQWSVSDGKWN